MQITLSRVVEAARQRKAAVTAEAGGYIILLAVQRLAAQPRRIDAERIQLSAAGEIFLEGGEPAPAADAEAALRRLLATLVSLSHMAPPALKAAAERHATGSLAGLESELTAALIPINHAASGRALARLYRETDKALRGSPGLSAAPGPTSSSEPGSTEIATAPARPAPSPAPAATSREPAPPSALAPSEVDSLEIDVDVVASDEEEAEASAGVVASGQTSAPSRSPVPLPSAPASEAPQLIVEELGELDVQALDADEGQSVAAPVSAPAAAPRAPAELAPETAADDRAARGDEATNDLDVLLAAELPPLAVQDPAEQRSGASPPSAERNDAGIAACERSLAGSTPSTNTEPEPPEHRSDLRALLDGFLAHTRCEEEMAANLRRMLGLEPWPSPAARAGAKMGPPEPLSRAP